MGNSFPYYLCRIWRYAGQTVTLKGKHLSAVSLVYLGYGIPHAFTVTSDTTVETIVTSQDTGNWGYVETPYGATYFSGFRLLPPPGTPVLIYATPMYGGEGDTVYIQGDSLHYAPAARYGCSTLQAQMPKLRWLM